MTGLDQRLSGKVALVTGLAVELAGRRSHDWLPRAQRWLLAI